VRDLALCDQVLDRAGDLLDGRLGVHAVLVEELDPVGLQAPERCFGDLSDVFRAAVEAPTLSRLRIDVEPEPGRDDHLVTTGGERFADEFFVDERAVDLGGVE
jgi:hypothetical protein